MAISLRAASTVTDQWRTGAGNPKLLEHDCWRRWWWRVNQQCNSPGSLSIKDGVLFTNVNLLGTHHSQCNLVQAAELKGFFQTPSLTVVSIKLSPLTAVLERIIPIANLGRGAVADHHQLNAVSIQDCQTVVSIFPNTGLGVTIHGFWNTAPAPGSSDGAVTTILTNGFNGKSLVRAGMKSTINVTV